MRSSALGLAITWDVGLLVSTTKRFALCRIVAIIFRERISPQRPVVNFPLSVIVKRGDRDEKKSTEFQSKNIIY